MKKLQNSEAKKSLLKSIFDLKKWNGKREYINNSRDNPHVPFVGSVFLDTETGEIVADSSDAETISFALKVESMMTEENAKIAEEFWSAFDESDNDFELVAKKYDALKIVKKSRHGIENVKEVVFNALVQYEDEII